MHVEKSLWPRTSMPEVEFADNSSLIYLTHFWITNASPLSSPLLFVVTKWFIFLVYFYVLQ